MQTTVHQTCTISTNESNQAMITLMPEDSKTIIATEEKIYPHLTSLKITYYVERHIT